MDWWVVDRENERTDGTGTTDVQCRDADEREASMDSSDQVDATGLITRIRDGDRVAWTRLTDRYTNLLWSIARGMGLNMADSADAVQTTWLRLVERIDSVRQPEYLGSWLATTMRRECLATLRRGGRERVSTLGGW